MAFCRNCGTQLQGDERFCVGCGADVSAKAATGSGTGTPAAATTSAAAATVVAAPAAVAPAAQHVVTVPGAYPGPGAIPIAVAMPPQAPAKRGGMMGTLLVLAALAGGYYYYMQRKTPPPPPPADNAALTKQQAFDAHWDAVDGFVQISNGKWTNNATVPIESSVLECDQYNLVGADLAQMRTTLNGPLQPGATSNFNPFQMGAVATNVNKVTCTIVHVKTVGGAQ